MEGILLLLIEFYWFRVNQQCNIIYKRLDAVRRGQMIFSNLILKWCEWNIDLTIPIFVQIRKNETAIILLWRLYIKSLFNDAQWLKFITHDNSKPVSTKLSGIQFR